MSDYCYNFYKIDELDYNKLLKKCMNLKKEILAEMKQIVDKKMEKIQNKDKFLDKLYTGVINDDCDYDWCFLTNVRFVFYKGNMYLSISSDNNEIREFLVKKFKAKDFSYQNQCPNELPEGISNREYQKRWTVIDNITKDSAFDATGFVFDFITKNIYSNFLFNYSRKVI